MRIPSGKTDQLIFFVAVDSTDLKTRETGLSSFTVYRSRNGGTATVYTTPTVAELSTSNMPGVYSLVIDEDTTIASGSDSEEYCVHITQASMAPVTRTIELYRRDTTSGRTLDVSAGGEAGVDWANVGSPTTAVDLSGTTIKTTQKVDVDTIKTNPVVNGGTITFPTTATLASTTNITAGTVTTATNVTTVNGLAANVITATSINDDAITDAKVASDVTIASVTGAVGSVTGAVGSVTGLTASDVGAIKTKTDFLPSATAGAAGGVFIAGTNAATVVTTSFTTTFTGNLTGNVGGNVAGSVGSVTGLTASNLDATISSRASASALATAQTDLDTLTGADGAIIASGTQTFNMTGDITGNLSGSVGSVSGNVAGNLTGTIGGLTAAALKDFFDTDSTTTYASAVSGSVVKEIADNAGGASLSVQDIVDGVWDEALADHLDSGSTGEQLSAAGAAGDPWATLIPGSYGAGTAGKIVGDNINATISSRATQTGVDDLPTNAELATALGTADDAVLAQVALVKVQTDKLGFTGANVNANVKAVNDITVSGSGTTLDPWGP